MKILAFAYACEPQKGSEPGAGWGWARLLARLGDAWIITRENNRGAIEAELSSIPEAASLHFIYVDLPERARSWKRGQRGIRLYYMLWQRAALRRARELHAEEGFDLVWHLTLANVWMGSLAALVGPPFIYGPVGGGIRLQWRLAGALGVRGTIYEIFRAAGQITGRYANPIARDAWRKAQVILVQNPETRDWLPKRYRSKAVVFPNALLTGDQAGRLKEAIARPPTALFAGRLLPWKGVAIAIRAVAATEEWRLIVVGKGSDESRLRRLARRLEVDQRIHFAGWLTRDQVLAMMRDQADVFVFPSVREEAGAVVVEALGCGLPVICLDTGGPHLLAGRAALVLRSSGGLHDVVPRLADLLSSGRFPDESAIGEQLESLTLAARGRSLKDILASAFSTG
jgi:glycosyltransferase involved in cell wall biosynthesis